MTNRKLLASLTGALVLVALVAAPALAEEESFRQSFSAFAVSMGTSNPPVVPTGGTTVQITVTRWSTQEQRATLLEALAESQEKLFDALQKQPEVGFVRATGARASTAGTGRPSTRLRYAREIKGEDGKRRVVLVTDRPISLMEQARRPRWRDYDVSFIVLDLDAENRGEGQMAIGVQLEFVPEENRLTIQSFATEPVRLNSVRMR